MHHPTTSLVDTIHICPNLQKGKKEKANWPVRWNPHFGLQIMRRSRLLGEDGVFRRLQIAQWSARISTERILN